MKKLIIQGELTDLNTYIKAERGNRYAGAKIKKEETERVFWACREQKLSAILEPIVLHFSWYAKDKRKDPDNIVFAKKFILDGMYKAGIIVNDTQEYILGFTDDIYINKNNPRVEVRITKVNKQWISRESALL